MRSKDEALELIIGLAFEGEDCTTVEELKKLMGEMAGYAFQGLFVK